MLAHQVVVSGPIRQVEKDLEKEKKKGKENLKEKDLETRLKKERPWW